MTPKRCVVKHCKTRDDNTDRTLFPIPKLTQLDRNRQEIRAAWISLCEQKCDPVKEFVVCDLHFAKIYVLRGKRHVTKYSLPTLNMNVSQDVITHYTKQITALKRRKPKKICKKIRCIVPNCINGSQWVKTKKGTTLFKFPERSNSLYTKWVEACLLSEIQEKQRDKRVCSEHFKLTDRCSKYKMRLQPDVIPSLNVNPQLDNHNLENAQPRQDIVSNSVNPGMRSPKTCPPLIFFNEKSCPLPKGRDNSLVSTTSIFPKKELDPLDVNSIKDEVVDQSCPRPQGKDDSLVKSSTTSTYLKEQDPLDINSIKDEMVDAELEEQEPPHCNLKTSMVEEAQNAELAITLDVTCRGCNMKSKDSIGLNNIFAPSTHELFKKCTGLDPSLSPHLSNAICTECISSCEAWQAFSNQCKETELFLDQQFKDDELKKQQESHEKEATLEKRVDDVTNLHEDFVLGDNEQKTLSKQCKDTHPLHNFDQQTEFSSEAESNQSILDECFDEAPRSHEGLLTEDNMTDDESSLNVDNQSDDADSGESSDYDPFYDREIVKTPHYYCPICSRNMLSFERLQSHLFVHESLDNIKCRKCDLPFKTEAELSAHCVDNHPNDNLLNYECTVCGKFFRQFKLLQSHFKIQHQRQKYKLCEYCGEQFFHLWRVHNHITTKHTSNAPKKFKCKLCHKSCVTKELLKNHSISHKKEVKNYKCNVCSKVFKLKNTLNSHAITHIKTKQCSNCPYNSQDAKEYKEHTKVCVFQMPEPIKRHSHTPRYKPICPLCSTNCRTLISLKHHLMDAHFGEEGVDVEEVIESVKTVPCDKCNKKFVDSVSLHIHIKGSHKEKTAKCSFCFMMLKSNQALRVHMLNSCKHKDSAKWLLGGTSSVELTKATT